MNILKQAFEFLNKPAQEKYNKKAQAYLDKFKKPYDERTVSEKILTECQQLNKNESLQMFNK